MPIIRAPRPESNFYLLDKQISEDKRLSWAARGMLIFLLGKPDHWRVSIQALVNETAAASIPSKRDAVYRVLTELQAAGYIAKRQSKGDGGMFGEVDYMVSESPSNPLTENTEAEPVTGDPLPVQPHTDEPHTAKPTLVSTDVKQRLRVASIEGSKGGPSGSLDLFAEQPAPAANPPKASRADKNPKAETFDAATHLNTSGVGAQVAADWLAQRKKLGALPTLTAIEGIEREAKKASISLEDALRECCERGWRGFKAEWYLKNQQSQSKPQGGAFMSKQARAEAENRRNHPDMYNPDGTRKSIRFEAPPLAIAQQRHVLIGRTLQDGDVGF